MIPTSYIPTTGTTPAVRAPDIMASALTAARNMVDSLKLALLANPLALTFADNPLRRCYASLEGFTVAPPQGSLGPLVQENLNVEATLKLADPLSYDIALTSIALGVNRLPLGTGPVRPIVTIVGASTNPVITLFNSAGVAVGSITLAISTVGGDTLVVDMDAKTVKKNGVNSIASITVGDFFLIDPLDQTNFGGLGPYITASSGAGTVSYYRSWR